ncbi:MAG TPA: hypothetical protein VNZ57_09745 [Longimicrobiales bacterium]|nr:hypothetical protein [Longimicrobiales bacterium]
MRRFDEPFGREPVLSKENVRRPALGTGAAQPDDAHWHRMLTYDHLRGARPAPTVNWLISGGDAALVIPVQ